MRRAVVVLGTTAAGLAALFSYKTHVAGIAVASTSPAAPTVTASPTTSSNGGSLAAGASVSVSPSESVAKKARPKASPTHSATPADTTPATAPSTAAPSKQATAPSTPAPTKSSAPAGPSGTFTGSSVNTQYGPVEVQITVSDGKITNANGSLPQGGDSIAQNALPQLNQEVLTAQSANIQAVSGATYTSQGYIGSLQQAVNQAGL
jgi:uncharacterized protein with FMN-binding domain